MDTHRDYFTEEPDDTTTPPTISFEDNEQVSSANPQPRPRRWRRILFSLILLLFIGIGVVFYFRYISPYATDAIATGYITSVERRGILFKTFEGSMVIEKSFGDTTRIYRENFSFSIPDTTLARRLQQLQDSSLPVTISINRYYSSLPWRGESECIAVAIIPPRPIRASSDSSESKKEDASF